MSGAINAVDTTAPGYVRRLQGRVQGVGKDHIEHGIMVRNQNRHPAGIQWMAVFVFRKRVREIGGFLSGGYKTNFKRRYK
jgi:hypothetical protein